VLSAVSFPGAKDGMKAAKAQVTMDPVAFLLDGVATYVLELFSCF
jgi:hypothetical protein